jgi:type I restriction enzyme M protein
MSPKGGIRPHKRFAVQSKRSEVLFVDYMAEHLTPTGRAAIIVPEGIIFQSGTAYKSLRKMLVEDNYLVGVISLPAGVFNPYSGVKTSILWLDKSLAKKTNKILFAKIENDGFDLGAQRRPITQNDLPGVFRKLTEYRDKLMLGEDVDFENEALVSLVEKGKIAANPEYNLSGERYRDVLTVSKEFDLFELHELFEIQRGGSPRPIDEYITEDENGINWIKIGDVEEGAKFINSTKQKIKPEGLKKSRLVEPGDFILSNSMSFGRPYIVNIKGAIHDGWLVFKQKKENLLKDYILYILSSQPVKQQFEQSATGGVVKNLNINLVKKVQIPLPPLSVQEEIVAEIESYQKIIDGARQVVENYKPKIDIDPEWEMVELGEVCNFIRGPFGGSLKKEIFVEDGIAVYEQSHAIKNDFNNFRYFIDDNKFNEMKRFEVFPGDIIMSCSGTMGKVAIVPETAPKGIINQALLKLSVKNNLQKEYLKLWMESENFQDSLKTNVYGAAIQNVASVKVLQNLKIALPPLDVQNEITNTIKHEQLIIDSNRQLIEIFEQKIKDRIAKVWGE